MRKDHRTILRLFVGGMVASVGSCGEEELVGVGSESEAEFVEGETEDTEQSLEEAEELAEVSERPRRGSGEPPDDTAGSCDPSLTPVVKDNSPNIVFNSAPDVCIVLLGGGDIVYDTTTTNNMFLGGTGSDIINVGSGDNLIAAGGGGDTVNANGGDDEIYGQEGADILTAFAGDDFIDGGANGDTIYAGDGNDTLLGGPGADILAGDGDNDAIEGGSGGDTIAGGSGDDVVEGGAGNDIIDGNGGNDVLSGGAGRDTVNGGSGDDHVIVYDLCELESGEILNGGSGTDTLTIPVDLSIVVGMGVIVAGFENTVVQQSASCTAGCICGDGVAPPPGWRIVGRATFLTDEESDEHLADLRIGPEDEPPIEGGERFVMVDLTTGIEYVSVAPAPPFNPSFLGFDGSQGPPALERELQVAAAGTSQSRKSGPGGLATPSRDPSKTILGPDTRNKISNTDLYPWSTIVNLKSRVTGGCTGVFVGPRHVLTAGHCVSNGHGLWIAPWGVVAGQTGGSDPEPFGTYAVVRYTAAKGYHYDENHRYDYAVLLIDNSEDHARWLGAKAFSDSELGEVFNLGYPGNTGRQPPDWDLRILKCGTQAETCTPWQWGMDCPLGAHPNGMYQFACDAHSGNSGGPVYFYNQGGTTRQIAGVVSQSGETTNFAARLGNVAIEELCRYMDEYPSQFRDDTCDL